MEMSTGHPSFDVVNVGMHVQKRLIERANWMEDMRPFIADKSLTAPDFDQADFLCVAVDRGGGGPDGKPQRAAAETSNLPITFCIKELFAQKAREAAWRQFWTRHDDGASAHRCGRAKGVYALRFIAA